MSGEHSELDALQIAYKSAVEEWIAAIRKEEALASVNHDIAEVDQWEAAHFAEMNCAAKSRTPRKNTKTRCVKNSSGSRLCRHWPRSDGTCGRRNRARRKHCS
jgi:hypothetical protein